MRLYNSGISGNCYKVRLILAHLGIDYERIDVDVVGQGPRPDELMDGNPAGGRVPLLVLDDGTLLPESNAILFHLARGTAYLPDDPERTTQVLRWMFFEQNLHECTVAVNRFLISYLKKPDDFAEVIAFNHSRGSQALAAMDRRLAGEPFFVGQRYSIADIALYAYTHVAEEGGFDLGAYPAIGAWIGRVREQAGHVPMD